ncbi:MAG: cation diffusion facilitator family transporter [Geobacteraceae bacterium]|nr:cation diffusion facilitator family transporter [Geobacteraceae bacterium]
MAHDHTHQIDNYNRAFAIGIGLNITFVIIEVMYGTIADSMALLADAGHNLSDVVSLVLAWGASVLATKSTTSKRTYGLRKATVMASLVSAVILLVALGGIAWEAFSRFTDPRPVAGMTVMVVAAIGVVINTVTALLFVKGQHNDLNIKGAFLHMAADAAVSLKDSLNYAMDAVPDKIDMPDINEFLRAQDRVERIHDLHVWPLSTTEVALTVHLVVRDEHIDNTFLHKLQEDLLHDFGIDHATFQIESISGENLCMLDKHTSC